MLVQTAPDYTAKVKELVKLFDYYQEALISRRAQEIRWWRRYLADASLVDTRSEDERKWRSLVMLPYGYSGIQSLVAHLVDMLMGPSPVFTTRGRGPEDTAATGNERLTNYTFVELNRLSHFAEEAFTRGCVQGMDVWKMSWKEDWITHDFKPSPVDEMRYKRAVAQAVEVTGLEPPGPDPMTGDVPMHQWEMWVSEVAKAGVQIPMIPAAGPKPVRNFVGPWLRSVELYDLAYDPKQPDFQQQHCIFHRVLVPREWLLEQAERNPERYDIDAIKGLPKTVAAQGSGRSISEQQTEYLDALGVSDSITDDPYYEDAVELIEFTKPADKKCSWGIIGNHATLVTRNPEQYPYKTRMQPWVAYYNVPTPGAAVGVSEYQQNGLLHEAGDQMLMALLDYARLQTMPILKHTAGLGISGPLAAPKPGDIIDLDPEETLEQAFDFSKPLSVSGDTIRFIKGEIDETSGVFSSVRGAPAEINRVSATESQGRQSASMARPKGRLYRFADALQPMSRLAFGMWRQFGSPEMLENIAGLDPASALAEDSLILGLQQNYVTVAAAINADQAMQVKQFMDGIQALGPQGLGLIQPGSGAALAAARSLFQLSRVPNGEAILQAAQQDVEAMRAAQAQQQPPPGEAPEGTPEDAAEDQAEGETAATEEEVIA
jgi:hypothetical protein